MNGIAQTISHRYSKPRLIQRSIPNQSRSGRHDLRTQTVLQQFEWEPMAPRCQLQVDPWCVMNRTARRAGLRPTLRSTISLCVTVRDHSTSHCVFFSTLSLCQRLLASLTLPLPHPRSWADELSTVSSHVVEVCSNGRWTRNLWPVTSVVNDGARLSAPLIKTWRK